LLAVGITEVAQCLSDLQRLVERGILVVDEDLTKKVECSCSFRITDRRLPTFDILYIPRNFEHDSKMTLSVLYYLSDNSDDDEDISFAEFFELLPEEAQICFAFCKLFSQ
jgi:hypothetical protein